MIDAGGEALRVFPSLPTFIPKPVPIEKLVELHAEIAASVDVSGIAIQLSNSDYLLGMLTALGNLIGVEDAASNATSRPRRSRR